MPANFRDSTVTIVFFGSLQYNSIFEADPVHVYQPGVAVAVFPKL